LIDAVLVWLQSPQRLKPLDVPFGAARLKPCPDDGIFVC
jgi:hypothetical protein